MSKQAHTPGPWEVHWGEYYPEVRKRFRPDHHSIVCGTVHGYMYSENREAEQRANARLIAAAPDLLEALNNLIAAMDRDGDLKYETLREDARHIVELATGGDK